MMTDGHDDCHKTTSIMLIVVVIIIDINIGMKGNDNTDD